MSERITIEKEKGFAVKVWEIETKKREARLAPDKKKLERLAATIVGLEMPEVSSKEAKNIIESAVEMLNKTSNFIKQKSIDL